MRASNLVKLSIVAGLRLVKLSSVGKDFGFRCRFYVYLGVGCRVITAA